MSDVNLEFRPIDLDKHADLCLRFIEETHLCSFGSMDGFYEEDGKGAERFIQRIRAKLSEDPQGCLHVWKDGVIVGQLHLGRFIDPAIGYVNFLYVIPECRGSGVATAIESYAADYFRRRGFRAARLSVTAKNVRAIRFYRRHGWKDLGPRPNRTGTHNMEKTFEPSAAGDSTA